MDVQRIQALLADFAQEREWDQFHTPKNLATAVVCEAGELAEIFQWMTDSQSGEVMGDPRLAEEIRDEMADVLLYLVRLADKLGVDLEVAMLAKIQKNGEKYPVDLSRGSAEKYSRRRT
jgi:dCTP diphosphatase